MIKYFDHKLCKKCGGMCCQRMAGSYHPNDFINKGHKITPRIIKLLMHTGEFGVDWWEGDPTGGGRGATYYLRPRHKEEKCIVGSWGGVCVHWSADKGCSLKKEKRPYQCRKLIPGDDGDCHYLEEDKAHRKDCAIAWYPFQKELEKAIDTYTYTNKHY